MRHRLACGVLVVSAAAHAGDGATTPARQCTASSRPPTMLFQGPPPGESAEPRGAQKGYAIARLPDGSFAFYDRYRPHEAPLVLRDRDGKQHILLPSLPSAIAESAVIAESSILSGSNNQIVLTPDNQIVRVFVQAEELGEDAAAKVGLRRYLNVWVQRAGPASATEPKMIWRGYNGSQMEYERLPSGRIIVPFGSMQPHASPAPPWGRHKTIIQYSDDNGATWTESRSHLTSPCYVGYNGLNEGACEPAIERLEDGRLWMLMRTQTGFLYESLSNDEGTTWRPAMASRFHASHGPPNIMRHKNGWLVVTWNNCELPPRHEGQGVYGGRDALHIAVSDDDGKSWRGFREIYLDHRRHENPARSGDRGTAYPLGAYTAEGTIVILAGQGAGGRNPILVDPNWIVETEARTDFSEGLLQWSVYKHHGPAKRFWRARTVGCKLVPHPTDPAAKCLHVRKPDALPADGATWNFPNGWKGRLTVRMMLREGGQGGVVCLNDRFFDPANDYGEDLAIFRTQMGADGRIGSAVLIPGTWHDVSFEWDLGQRECQVLVDGKSAAKLSVRHRTLNGVSYIRLRSAARDIDEAGFLVDRVHVSIGDPYAPACTATDQIDQQRRYVEKVVATWE